MKFTGRNVLIALVVALMAVCLYQQMNAKPSALKKKVRFLDDAVSHIERPAPAHEQENPNEKVW